MRALLIDDHPLVFQDVQGAMNALGGRMSLVVAASASAARTVLAGEASFELIVLDLHMGEGDGLCLLSEIRVRHPGVPLLALSSGTTAERAIQLDSLRLLTEVWRQAERPEMTGDAQPASMNETDADWRFRTTAHSSLLDLGLTRRQTEVLVFLMEGWSNKAIARELSLSVDTVKDHVTALMRALNVSSRTQAVLVVTRRLRETQAPSRPRTDTSVAERRLHARV
jgi:DNA-binding NarL/FixJ family response regulator